MKAVIQRVKSAAVQVDDQVVGEIGPGILTLLGVEKGDSEEQIEKMLQKILTYRIFADENGKMNRSLVDVGGSHLVVSQFTLAANNAKGRRPSFESAADPRIAEDYYNRFLEFSRAQVETQSGQFGAEMQVRLINDGPVTFIFDI